MNTRGLLILALIAAVLLGLFGLDAYERRTAALALPQQRIVAENIVRGLALSTEQKGHYLRDLAEANDKAAIEDVTNKARRDGDPSYRAAEAAEMEQHPPMGVALGRMWDVAIHEHPWIGLGLGVSLIAAIALVFWPKRRQTSIFAGSFKP